MKAADYPIWHPRWIALEKRRETIAAKKLNTGCDCHSLPLLQCPNFKPVLRPTNVGMTWAKGTL